MAAVRRRRGRYNRIRGKPRHGIQVLLDGGEEVMIDKPSELLRSRAPAARTAQVCRETGETAVELALNLDGTGEVSVATGVGFFDHMLTLLARHSLIDLEVKARGDLHVDAHHTVEDVGICYGR